MIGSIYLFGYGKFGSSIAASLREQRIPLKIVISNSANKELADSDKVEVELINIESDRSLMDLNIPPQTTIICALDSKSENLFLALSLRDIYKTNYIVALSDSIHLNDKLKIAGVDRIIDAYAISSNMINSILKKPIATKFLQGFINKSHDYIFKEIIITKDSTLNGKLLEDIDFRAYNIIFIGMVDKEKGDNFIFKSLGVSHKIDSSDVLICIGELKNLEKFIEDTRSL